MATKRSIVVTALLALLVTTSGCAAFQDGGDAQTETNTQNTVQADSIKQNAVESSENADSYDFSTTITSEQNGQSSTTNQSGSLDIAEERARIEQTALGQSITQYLVNGTIYANSSGTWVKQDGSGTNFWSTHPLVQQRQFLANSSASFEENTTIDGQDVYELSVNLTAEQLQANAEQQLGPNATAQTSFENISYTVYVTHGDNRIKRTQTQITTSAQGQNTTSTTELTFTSYNDVSVELPPGAENAQTVNQTQN